MRFTLKYISTHRQKIENKVLKNNKSIKCAGFLYTYIGEKPFKPLLK